MKQYIGFPRKYGYIGIYVLLIRDPYMINDYIVYVYNASLQENIVKMRFIVKSRIVKDCT